MTQIKFKKSGFRIAYEVKDEDIVLLVISCWKKRKQ